MKGPTAIFAIASTFIVTAAIFAEGGKCPTWEWLLAIAAWGCIGFLCGHESGHREGEELARRGFRKE